jgi:serine/threonine protein kinase
VTFLKAVTHHRRQARRRVAFAMAQSKDAGTAGLESTREISGVCEKGWSTSQARIAHPVPPDLQGLTVGSLALVKTLSLKTRHEEAEHIFQDARLLAQLPAHPHVVRYYGAILERRRGGSSVLVLSEWSEQGTLHDLLHAARCGGSGGDDCVPLALAMDLFIHVCSVCAAGYPSSTSVGLFDCFLTKG